MPSCAQINLEVRVLREQLHLRRNIFTVNNPTFRDWRKYFCRETFCKRSRFGKAASENLSRQNSRCLYRREHGNVVRYVIFQIRSFIQFQCVLQIFYPIHPFQIQGRPQRAERALIAQTAQPSVNFHFSGGGIILRGLADNRQTVKNFCVRAGVFNFAHSAS